MIKGLKMNKKLHRSDINALKRQRRNTRNRIIPLKEEKPFMMQRGLLRGFSHYNIPESQTRSKWPPKHGFFALIQITYTKLKSIHTEQKKRKKGRKT